MIRRRKDDYRRHHSKQVARKVRNYYTVTDSGLQVLERARAKIRKLVDEVLMGG